VNSANVTDLLERVNDAFGGIYYEPSELTLARTIAFFIVNALLYVLIRMGSLNGGIDPGS